MNRFFIDLPLVSHMQLELPTPIAHHWGSVLRSKLGDSAVLFNGKGGEFEAYIIQINKRAITVQLTQFNPTMRTPKRETKLALVMTKGDRLDYAIQKATELGVAEIQLLTSERCEMRLKYARDAHKIAHWYKIAISACEQCGMNRIPRIHEPLELGAWLQIIAQDSSFKLVLAPDQPISHTLWNAPAWIDCAPIICLIGPEGGLSADEIAQATSVNFHPWSIGERILRAETAPIVALSIINQHDQTMNS